MLICSQLVHNMNLYLRFLRIMYSGSSLRPLGKLPTGKIKVRLRAGALDIGIFRFIFEAVVFDGEFAIISINVDVIVQEWPEGPHVGVHVPIVANVFGRGKFVDGLQKFRYLDKIFKQL